MTHPRLLILRSLLALATMATLASTARATNYSPLIGPHVSYTNINESDSQIAGPPPVSTSPLQLFGQPVLSPAGSDILSFNAMTFMVNVADGQFELQDGTLRMDISPTNPAGAIHAVSIDEGGGWRVFGPDGSALAEATLLFNNMRITSVNGVALGTAIVVNPTFSQTASAQTGTAHVNTSTGDVTITSNGANAAGIWDITANFDIDAALAGAGKMGKVTGLSLALNNQLFGNTQVVNGLSLAEIDKKHFIISTTTTDPVPEPSTIILGLAGGVGLLVTGRKWRKGGQA